MKVENVVYEDAYLSMLNKEKVRLFEESIEAAEIDDILRHAKDHKELVFFNDKATVLRPANISTEGETLYYLVPSDKTKSKIRITAKKGSPVVFVDVKSNKTLTKEEIDALLKDLDVDVDSIKAA